jgi:hypothetical protein
VRKYKVFFRYKHRCSQIGFIAKKFQKPSPTPKTKQVGQKRKKSGTTAKPAPKKKKKTFQ